MCSDNLLFVNPCLTLSRYLRSWPLPKYLIWNLQYSTRGINFSWPLPLSRFLGKVLMQNSCSPWLSLSFLVAVDKSQPLRKDEYLTVLRTPIIIIILKFLQKDFYGKKHLKLVLNNLPHSYAVAIAEKWEWRLRIVLAYFTWVEWSFLGNFYRHSAIFIWSHWSNPS